MKLHINHISELLPHVLDKPEFKISHKGLYSVIDYHYVDSHTFDDPITLECRGIKFDLDGKILARPFHKFFNLGEKKQAEDIPWHMPHVVMPKLDGSLVHPCRLAPNDDLVWMTRAGITQQSEEASQHVSPELHRFAAAVYDTGYTPLFEYVSPTNRIVLRYDEPRLVLLAIRHTIRGGYLSHQEMTQWASEYGVTDWAGGFPEVTDVYDFVDATKKLQDAEGYVIRFDSGYTLKIKADDYVLKHRVKSDFSIEKNVLRAVIEGKTDDILPLLDHQDRERLEAYSRKVIGGVVGVASQVADIVSDEVFSKHSDKEFAFLVMETIKLPWRSACFTVRKGKATALEAVKQIVIRHCVSSAKLEELRPFLGATWV